MSEEITGNTEQMDYLEALIRRAVKAALIEYSQTSKDDMERTLDSTDIERLLDEAGY